MFQWLKKRRLHQLHRKLLAAARGRQRKGDIQAFAQTTAAAEQVGAELARLDRGSAGANDSTTG